MSGRTLLTFAALAAALALLADGTLRPRVATAATMKTGGAPVLLPVPSDPTVSFKIAFRTGTEDDPPGKEGLAALTAQLMSEGATKKHTYPEILELLYPMAAGYGVRVDKELTTFSGRVHKDNLAAYTGLLLDAVLQPAFDEADFARLKQRSKDFIEKTLRYSSDEFNRIRRVVIQALTQGATASGAPAALDA